MQYLTQIVRRISLILGGIAAVLVVALSLIVAADVAGRVLFNTPLQGSIEIVRSGVVAIAFLAAPYTVTVGAFVRATPVVDRFGPKLRRVFELVANLLTAGVALLIVVVCFPFFLSSVETGDYLGSGAINIPNYPIWAAVIVGMGVTVLSAIDVAFNGTTDPEDTDTENDEEVVNA